MRTIQRTVLNGFSNMNRLDLFRMIQIGDGATYLQDPIIGPGRQAKPFHRVFHESAAIRIQPAESADMRR